MRARRKRRVAAGSDRGVRRAREIADFFDNYYVDPILGLLLPGVGDAVSSAFGLYLVGIAVQRRLPAVVIARMLINLSLDATIGAIPLLGDAFDFFFKANQRNLDLLERPPRMRARPGDWIVVALAALAIIGAVLLPIYLVVKVLGWLF